MDKTVRTVARLIRPEPVLEGAGVRLRRSIGTRGLTNLDPFLLLDHFETDDPEHYAAGFPQHPHRGIETITVLRRGQIRHVDSLGNSGTLSAGDVQWMTSGSGILHEEMPVVLPEGIAGLQIWVNLPAREKMCSPKYRDLRHDAIARFTTPAGATIRLIAGTMLGHEGPVADLATRPTFVDVELPEQSEFQSPIPPGHTAFVYLESGAVAVGPADHETTAEGSALLVLSDGEWVRIRAASNSRLVFAAARPLHESIARYGPFVMNTREEIEQTVNDLRTGRFIREQPSHL